MSCAGCKKAFPNEKMEKIRQLAKKSAEMDGKVQVIVERSGSLSVECEECWKKDGTGRVVEYFIV